MFTNAAFPAVLCYKELMPSCTVLDVFVIQEKNTVECDDVISSDQFNFSSLCFQRNTAVSSALASTMLSALSAVSSAVV